MNADRFAEVERVCQAALDLPASARDAFLDEACRSDPALRAEVASLLAGASTRSPSLATEASPALTLTVGQRLGPYEVTGTLGAGGMGEVYEARDTRLRRTVAIKVLSPRVSVDPGRRARFEREARIVAALNHPHICVLHDVGDHQGATFLVMERLEGHTLAARIRKGPLPAEQALGVATQIADALAAAHRRGIVHCDLKPGNVMLTRSGAKLLDFGLAKLLDVGVTNTSASEEPEQVGDRHPATTDGRRASGRSPDGGVGAQEVRLQRGEAATVPLTATGARWGTLRYMAPEQLRGRVADARSDVWAFGCVLYEMLTGRPAFGDDSEGSTVAAILEHEPAPVTSSRAPAVRTFVRTCLAKDADARFQNGHDLWLALQLVTAETTPDGPSQQRLQARGWRAGLLAGIGVGVLVAGMAAGLVLALRTQRAVPRPAVAVDLPLPAGEQLGTGHSPALALSPDGARVAFVRAGADGSQLYVKELAGMEAVALEGISGEIAAPFFSPDGRWIGIFQGGILKKVPVGGGTPVALCRAPAGHGGSWNTKDVIVFSPAHAGAGLSSVSAGGGAVRPVTRVDAGAGEIAHYWPVFLDDRTVLFTSAPRMAFDAGRIEAVSLETGERRVVLDRAYFPQMADEATLLFVRGGTLMRVPFDRRRLAVTGSPEPILREVRIDYMGPPQLALSASGVLAYVPGRPFGAWQRLVMLDRSGTTSALPGTPTTEYVDAPVFSPDGRRVAYTVGLDDADVWTYDLARGVRTRVTFGGRNINPAWSPDGRLLAFATTRGGKSHLTVAAASGDAPPREIATRWPQYGPMEFTSDGEHLALAEYNPTTRLDILQVPLSGSGPAVPLLATDAQESDGRMHPNGRWMAYRVGTDISQLATGWDVYVRSTDGRDAWRITTRGGDSPVWSRDGRELFYRVGRRLMVVPIAAGDTFQAGEPRALFDLPGERYDVAPDGQHFVCTEAPPREPATSFRVIVGWRPTPLK